MTLWIVRAGVVIFVFGVFTGIRLSGLAGARNHRDP